MRKHPACVVLGYYTQAAAAERTYREINALGIRRVSLFRPDGSLVGAHSNSRRYAALRLPGEALITVETDSASLDALASMLKSKDEPAIFFQRDGPITDSPTDDACELFSRDGWSGFMGDLARQHDRPGPPVDRHQLVARLCESELAIDAAHNFLMGAVRLGRRVTGSAEWLLDNHHLVRTHAWEVHRDLPRRYSQILPILPSQLGKLRVCEIARELARRTDHPITKANIIDSLRGYQTVETLSIAEIWAFPLLLRFALRSLGQIGRTSQHGAAVA
jgi:hypothetical protein